MINGTKWIHKKMQELADKFGFSIRDIQRHLKTLCDLGWLKREQLEAKQYKRRYWYTFGEVDPFCPVRERQADVPVSDKPAGSFLSSKNGQTGTGAARRQSRFAPEEQPHNIPDADATSRFLQQQSAMVFVPAPGGRRGTCPAETRATRRAKPEGF